MTYLPSFEPPFLDPSAPDIMETPRDQRTAGEVPDFLKSHFRPFTTSGRKSKELRWVTTYLIAKPCEDSAPKHAD